MKLIPPILKSFPPTFLIAVVLYLNAMLFYEPHFEPVGKHHLNADVLSQLYHLEREMHTGAGEEMQKLFPEGLVFMNALYGLSWCEMVKDLEPGSELYTKAIQESGWAWKEIDTKGPETFPRLLPLPYGAFFSGWSNYLLGKKLGLQASDRRDTNEVRRFTSHCDKLAAAFDSLPSPFPESYFNMSWPADGMVCIAALAQHDRIMEPAYTETINKWIAKVRLRLDSHGLIPHSSHPVTGEPLEPARGSSQSLMLCFLRDIDTSFARQQFIIYKTKFLDQRFGLPGVREYPKGTSGTGDVDSGPVLLGIGGAASVVGLRTMALYGEHHIAVGIRNSIEAFGAGSGQKEKKYLFGALPMADGFIAWANSTENTKARALNTNEPWRGRFQAYSALMLLLSAYWLFRTWKRFIQKRNVRSF